MNSNTSWSEPNSWEANLFSRKVLLTLILILLMVAGFSAFAYLKMAEQISESTAVNRKLTQQISESTVLNRKLVERLDEIGKSTREAAGASTKDAVAKLLDGANLTKDQIERITDAAVRNLGMAVESAGTDEDRKALDDQLKQALSKLAQGPATTNPAWPLVERALLSAIGEVLPEGKALAAAKIISSVGGAAATEALKTLIGEIVKDTYGWLRGKDGQKVSVTCNCGPKPREDGGNGSKPNPPTPVVPPDGEGGVKRPGPAKTSTPPVTGAGARESHAEPLPITVMFRTNRSSPVNEHQREQLWRAIAINKASPDREIVLYAYTDRTGSDTGNRKLRSARAESVRGALLKIDPNLRVRIADTSKDEPPVLSQKESIPGNRVVIIKSEAARK